MSNSVYHGLACMFRANKTSNCTNAFRECSLMVYYLALTFCSWGFEEC